MKTKEQIAKYNKEYFARPEVIARAKIRNQKYKQRRKLYKKTNKGKENENKYRRKHYALVGVEKHLKARYGLSLADYNKLLNEQNELCAICKLPSKSKLHVDHNHITGKVRGLLCGSCNRGLGLFRDDSSILKEASEYLYKNV